MASLARPGGVFLMVLMTAQTGGHGRGQIRCAAGFGKLQVTSAAVFAHPLQVIGMRHAQGRLPLGEWSGEADVRVAHGAVARRLLLPVAFEALAFLWQLDGVERLGVKDFIMAGDTFDLGARMALVRKNNPVTARLLFPETEGCTCQSETHRRDERPMPFPHGRRSWI